ncbi:pseudouridine synthase, RluA family [Sporocytophaga myxococcoides]|uniref:Pseudouridine synthase n=1 Tax=Sporocytophaga myxococcoides TaxID=153721 RepID=A0A098LLW5_9BACT|nr:RluA family pseudouridine synthase [Sporocytophaga myxococcoides]GAL87484.1 pseudouridine synthase, RluA family [Sporocytophaga myxococcoides]
MKNKKSTGFQTKSSKPLIFKVAADTDLMKFLMEMLPHKSRTHIKSLLTHKQIYVDGKPVSQYNTPLAKGQEVSIDKGNNRAEINIPGIKIIYEDKDLIVINKAEGLLSIATEYGTDETAYSLLSKYLKTQHYSNRIFIVHRLDRDTSGVMMYAKSQHIQELLQKDWNNNVTERTYLAIVQGVPEKDKDTISSYLKESKTYKVHSGKSPVPGSEKAITKYEILMSKDNYSLVKVNIETGKKNQIRVHMQDIGHPIIGDKKYGSTVNPIKRLGLHAWVLAFTHPVTNKEMRFQTELPGKFRKIFPNALNEQ